jgi:ParB family chromosome partitioning protein
MQTELPVELISHNPYQPRKTIDADDLAELAASVLEHGILQPLLVRQVEGQFQLIAGERRLRAAQEVGLKSVPVRVVDMNDQQTMEAALVENIQRTDLNPIEKAQSFKEYMDNFGLNHEQLAQRLGLARSSITNLVNLLELTPDVQNALRGNMITEGHAKVLKGVKDPTQQVSIYKQVVAQGLSVKATEGLIREMREEPAETESAPRGSTGGDAFEKTAHVKGIEDELRQRLAVKVDIKLKARDKGQIVLKFESNDDFDRIVEWLRPGKAAA